MYVFMTDVVCLSQSNRLYWPRDLTPVLLSMLHPVPIETEVDTDMQLE